MCSGSPSQDAEDAAHEALITLDRKVGTLRSSTALASWMSRTVRHECLRRARSRWPHDPPEMGDVRSPEDEVLRRLDAEQVAKAISALPDLQRQTAELNYLPPSRRISSSPESSVPRRCVRSTRCCPTRSTSTPRCGCLSLDGLTFGELDDHGEGAFLSRSGHSHTADLHLKVRRTFHRWQRSRCSDSRTPAGALVALAAANTTPILIVPYKAPQRAGARSGSAYGERHQLRSLAFLPFAKIRTAAG